MKNLFQKIKFFYIKRIRREETYQRHGIKPARDWSIVLSINFIVFVALASFSFYMYIQIKDDKLFVAKDAGTLKDVVVNIDFLNKAIEDINARESVTIDLESNGIKIPDPSL